MTRPGGRRQGAPSGRGGRRPSSPDGAAKRLPLPASTDRLVPSKPAPGHNLGLWLDRFVRWSPRWDLKENDRLEALEMFARRWESVVARDALARRVAGVDANDVAEVSPGRWHQRFRLRQAGPMVIDYGRVHVLEASLSFDRLLGVPRIPGSALKGIARAFAEERGDSAESVELLFGAISPSAVAGRVAFFDALPEEGAFELAVDVLTPHFGAYYQGDGPPGEWLSPVPTTFLAVVATTFVFDVEGDDAEHVRHGAALLRDALQERGAGAKTAAGYGYFGAPA